MSGVTLGICRKELNALHVGLRFAAAACGEEREGDCALAPSTLDDTLAPNMLDDTFAAVVRELASACLRTAAAESARAWRAFSSATTAWYSLTEEEVVADEGRFADPAVLAGACVAAQPAVD
jgi:hypothetical protein